MTLARHTPLRRSSRLEPRRKSPRRQRHPMSAGPEIVRDAFYRAWVRDENACAAGELGPCNGRHHAHHKRDANTGMSQKTSDLTCICLCDRHHTDHHRGRGVFKGWTPEERAAWHEEKQHETQDMAHARGVLRITSERSLHLEPNDRAD